MKDSEVYLRAAEFVEDTGSGMCRAIYYANEPDCEGALDRQYRALDGIMRPVDSEVPNGVVYAYWGNHWSSDDAEVRECRVLALLFMHQIAKDEERK